jgi:hypothetical protein
LPVNQSRNAMFISFGAGPSGSVNETTH